MLRGMAFIDHLNFDIALRNQFKSKGLEVPRLDFNKLPACVAARIALQPLTITKTFLFVPKPVGILEGDKALVDYHHWATGLRSQKNFEVIEGTYIARQVDPAIPMDIQNRSTYFKVEKGTDINLAVQALSKAFFNAFDVGIFFSADTDYLPVYRTLRMMGKLVVVAALKGQRIPQILPEVDDHVFMDEAFFDQCLRPSSSAS